MREIKFRAWVKDDKRMIVHEQEFIPLKVTSIGVFRLSPTHEDCPRCGRHLDEIDFDYQSCSKCGYDIEEKKYNAKLKREPTEDDYLNGDADILTGQWY